MARRTEAALAVLNVTNTTLVLVVPCTAVHVTKAEPVPSFVIVIFTIVLWMKLVSYAHCNMDLRWAPSDSSSDVETLPFDPEESCCACLPSTAHNLILRCCHVLHAHKESSCVCLLFVNGIAGLCRQLSIARDHRPAAEKSKPADQDKASPDSSEGHAYVATYQVHTKQRASASDMLSPCRA